MSSASSLPCRTYCLPTYVSASIITNKCIFFFVFSCIPVPQPVPQPCPVPVPQPYPVPVPSQQQSIRVSY
jgi:hypothetical protein